jgi:NAD(P)H dehydrogenase (quinone)
LKPARYNKPEARDIPNSLKVVARGAFATGGSISNGKEITMMAILEAMLINKMIVASSGGSFGFGASATTGESPGIDEKELAAAHDLGKRIAEVAAAYRRGLAQVQ